jgi:hypothetical protein
MDLTHDRTEKRTMGQSIPLGTQLGVGLGERAAARPDATSIPWTIWCMVAGIASGMVGGIWDISWHMSIGRDTFWTPAHIAIQMTGVLVGIACGYLILSATFGGESAARETSVKIWGFRGPLGSFIAVWGCVAMLTSAPFDNWWHNAYGLDVKIVSPPHTLLSLGSFAIKVGTLALMAGLMNRASEALRGRLMWLFAYVGATAVAQAGLILTQPTWPVYMHSASCYLAVAIGIPAVLVGTAWGAGNKWACTRVGAIYTAILLAAEWILPLFPAEPKLGPVYQHVTHFIPLRFPMLLIVPAVLLDLLWNKVGDWKRWRLAAVTGAAFLMSFVAVQWPFANFLMSPAARNRIFGMAYFSYFDPAGFLYDPYAFVAAEKTRGAFWITMALAVVAAMITSRLGLAWGDWMRRMKR